MQVQVALLVQPVAAAAAEVQVQVHHSFGYFLKSKLRYTSYSPENQEKINQAISSGETEVKVDHIIQAGPNVGTTVEHVINLATSKCIVGSKQYILKSFDFSEEEEKHYRHKLLLFFQYRKDPTEEMIQFLRSDEEGVYHDIERFWCTQSEEINFKMHKMMVYYNILDKQEQIAEKLRYSVDDTISDSLINELIVFAKRNY